MHTHFRPNRLLALTLPVLLASPAWAQSPAELGLSGAPPRGEPRVRSATVSPLSKVPFAFIENRGQWETPARFIATRGPVRIYVEPTALTVAVESQPGEAAVPVTRFAFEGADAGARAEGVDATAGVYNFYRGGADTHAEQVHRYQNVLLRGVYPGIDVRLREHQDRLEYDLLLAPGADLDAVVVKCEGIERLELADDGRLLLHTAGGEVLTQSPPTTWAELPDGELQPLECHYVLLGDERYGYALPERAGALPVVIDPGLEWSTFLGGADYEDCYAIDRDPSGRIIVAGTSRSIGWSLPGVGAPFSLNNGGFDSYVAVLDPSANGAAQVVWWTFFGGSLNDWIWDIDTNAAGQVFVAGDTLSPDFPVTAGAFQAAHLGDYDGYITVLDPATGTLVHSTYFGGSGWDTAQRIIVEGSSLVTIGGGTESPDLATSAGAFDSTLGGNRDAYFAQFDLSLTGAASLLYSTFVGGSGQDGWVSERQFDLARAASGVVAVVTSSFSSDFPVTPNAYDSTNGGGQDPVLIEIDPSMPGASGLVYGTYLGTAAAEGSSQIEIDPSGGYIITGFSYSPLFPTTPGAPYRTFIGPVGFNDGWLIKFDRTQASQLVYSTYLPGGGYEGFLQLQVDTNGTVYGVGFTGRDNLVNNNVPITCNALDKTFEGPWEGFVLALTPAGNGLSDVHYLSYLGGTGADQTNDVLIESIGGTPVLVVSGTTLATDLPTTPGALQPVQGGDADGFAVRIRLNPYLMCIANPNSASTDGAHLCASGSTDLAANNLNLFVNGLPGSSLGYFLMSKTEAAPFALPAPSEGTLCLGGTIVRFAAFVQAANINGTVSFSPDLANIPSPGAPLVPGDTAVFQYWYRDVGGRSNTSSGVAVTFD
ncbi:MAG: hypothetical protein R3F49_04935 [Planctomycetota bacterium]